ncbi:hypothetical protein Tco_0573863 [Tanacetum coccineum]
MVHVAWLCWLQFVLHSAGRLVLPRSASDIVCLLFCLLSAAVCLICSRSSLYLCDFCLMSAAVCLICSRSSSYLCDSVLCTCLICSSSTYVRTSLLLKLYLYDVVQLPLSEPLCLCICLLLSAYLCLDLSAQSAYVCCSSFTSVRTFVLLFSPVSIAFYRSIRQVAHTGSSEVSGSSLQYSIKNWRKGTIFSGVIPECFPIFRSFCITGGVFGEDPASPSHCRQELAVQTLSSNKAPFRRYPECFIACWTADTPEGAHGRSSRRGEQVTLFDSIKHCFVSLDAPTAAHQASGSGSGAGAEVSAPSVEGNVVEENVIPESAFLNPTDPECDVTVAEKDVAQRQPEKAKRKKLLKRSDPLPAKRLRMDHPSLACGTGGKSLASLRQSLPEGSLTLGASSPADIPTHVTVSRLKSLLEEKETESAEVLRLRNQVSVLAADKSSLSAKLRTDFLTCSTGFPPLPREMTSSLRGILPCLPLTALAGRRMAAEPTGLELSYAAGHEHESAGLLPLSVVVAYDPETAKNHYFDAIVFYGNGPLANLLKLLISAVPRAISPSNLLCRMLFVVTVDIVFLILCPLIIVLGDKASTSAVLLSVCEDLDTDKDGMDLYSPTIEDPRLDFASTIHGLFL